MVFRRVTANKRNTKTTPKGHDTDREFSPQKKTQREQQRPGTPETVEQAMQARFQRFNWDVGEQKVNIVHGFTTGLHEVKLDKTVMILKPSQAELKRIMGLNPLKNSAENTLLFGCQLSIEPFTQGTPAIKWNEQTRPKIKMISIEISFFTQLKDPTVKLHTVKILDTLPFPVVRRTWHAPDLEKSQDILELLDDNIRGEKPWRSVAFGLKKDTPLDADKLVQKELLFLLDLSHPTTQLLPRATIIIETFPTRQPLTLPWKIKQNPQYLLEKFGVSKRDIQLNQVELNSFERSLDINLGSTRSPKDSLEDLKPHIDASVVISETTA